MITVAKQKSIDPNQSLFDQDYSSRTETRIVEVNNLMLEIRIPLYLSDVQ